MSESSTGASISDCIYALRHDQQAVEFLSDGKEFVVAFDFRDDRFDVAMKKYSVRYFAKDGSTLYYEPLADCFDDVIAHEISRVGETHIRERLDGAYHRKIVDRDESLFGNLLIVD